MSFDAVTSSIQRLLKCNKEDFLIVFNANYALMYVTFCKKSRLKKVTCFVQMFSGIRDFVSTTYTYDCSLSMHDVRCDIIPADGFNCIPLARLMLV